ncbi:hypothetical protein H2198_008824 [Neophaeococcomyces mojaviensis]|uniref:Uncharacterized protein n=1 Tax=Neophaeococcomyces mojaviensis TaxID=3383035 RepID=A0ACC2ZW83_9EURO|nr:hypothetical protein H2198_008824 [Knufia sp. JES_112]
MYFSTYALAAISVLFTSVHSQSIDPNEVPLSLRDSWCTNQISACPLICTQETDGSAATYSNTCDPATLAYSCVCSNGLTPNITEYSQTIPYYTCTQYNNDCVTNCGLANNACADNCRTSNPCGAQNPTRVNTTSTSSTSTATATGSGSESSGTGTAVYSGFGSAASSTSGSQSSDSSTSGSKSGAAMVVDMGRIYGLGVVAAGIFAGFALL